MRFGKQRPKRADAETAFDLTLWDSYEAKYPKATTCLYQKDHERLMTFYDFTCRALAAYPHQQSALNRGPLVPFVIALNVQSLGCLTRDGICCT